MSTLVPEVGVVTSTSGWYRKARNVDVDALIEVQVHRTHARFIANFSDFRFPYPPASVSVLLTQSRVIELFYTLRDQSRREVTGTSSAFPVGTSGPNALIRIEIRR